ncbi:hypothetical protein ACTMSW_30475 [Micromonospora sp. BQ11]|uniref:hypothetical protein n=1 Tax=Micromonospora sp. BQ11 TaxID=3452212 RepID=UPI003F895B6A
MNAHRMDQDTVERLLGGLVDDAPHGPRSLVVLLSAVRAAPQADELAGEAAALDAYRSARSGAPLDGPRAARRWVGRTTVRAAVAGALVAATGGVAFAAAGGALPNPLRRPAPAVTPSSTAPQATAPGATAGPGAPGRGGTTSPGTDGAPSPSASVVGLCRAYRADAGNNPGRTLDNPVFGDLVDAAGGRDQVPGYCDRVLAGSPGTTDDTPTARPGNRPTVRPTTPETQQPATPTRKPSPPTTGRPTARDTEPAAPGTAPRTPGRPTGSTGG